MARITVTFELGPWSEVVDGVHQRAWNAPGYAPDTAARIVREGPSEWAWTVWLPAVNKAEEENTATNLEQATIAADAALERMAVSRAHHDA